MSLNRNRLYLLLSIACLAGYAWIIFNANTQTADNKGLISLCLFKHVTGIPCPSCGSTRSIHSLLSGNFIQSLYWNPFGIILLLILIISPLWIIYDLILKKDSLFNAYIKTEIILRKKIIAVPLLLLVLANWIWNYYKTL